MPKELHPLFNMIFILSFAIVCGFYYHYESHA